MDYEKAYKEALERAKNLAHDNAWVTTIFPELKESEDERILNEIIEFLRCSFYVQDSGLDYEKIGNWIAYLEKQKDNKFVPRVLPCSAAWFEDGEEFEQQEQKPLTGIYWHAIKKGDTLPCRAYLWTTNYEKYHDCFEGRLIPNVENVTVGADMWYLPVDDIQTLPREGIDELPKEQKPAEWSDEDEKKLRTVISLMRASRAVDPFYDKMCLEGWLKSLPERFNLQPKQEWSEEDEQYLLVCKNALSKYQRSDHWDANIISKWLEEKLKSIRPQPHWKPSEEQMDALHKTVCGDDHLLYRDTLIGLYQQLKQL